MDSFIISCVIFLIVIIVASFIKISTTGYYYRWLILCFVFAFEKFLYLEAFDEHVLLVNAPPYVYIFIYFLSWVLLTILVSLLFRFLAYVGVLFGAFESPTKFAKVLFWTILINGGGNTVIDFDNYLNRDIGQELFDKYMNKKPH